MTQHNAQTPTFAIKESITIDDSVSCDLLSDLQLTLQLLKNEYNEDFLENCKTHKLTDKQKALVPLMAQVSNAFILENQLEDIKWVLAGIAKAQGAHKDYWNI
jgi:hypothetical protein